MVLDLLPQQELLELSYDKILVSFFFPLQKAKKKPLAKVDPKELGVDPTHYQKKLNVLSVEDPPTREAGSKVADVDELVSKLKEAGVV